MLLRCSVVGFVCGLVGVGRVDGCRMPGSAGSLMCVELVCVSTVGVRGVRTEFTNSNSRTQGMWDSLHSWVWSFGAVVGSVFGLYLPDSHSSEIPIARSLHVILFDDSNWFMLMPVAWYVVLARCVFPELMRSMNASRRVCIHPHSMFVSSSFSLAGVLLNFMLNCVSLF